MNKARQVSRLPLRNPYRALCHQFMTMFQRKATRNIGKFSDPVWAASDLDHRVVHPQRLTNAPAARVKANVPAQVESPQR